MKLVLHGPKAGAFKLKESKARGKVEEEGSQNGNLKQIKSSKSKDMKSHSSDLSKKKSPSVKSPAKEVNGTSTTKKSQKNNLDSVGSMEDKSRKRKREEEQKKSKSKSTKSANEEEKRKNENIVAIKNSNSGMVSPVQSPSRKRNAENGTKDHDVKPKKPNATAVKTAIGKHLSSMGDRPSQKSMTGSKISKSEEGKEEQTESFTDKKWKTYSRRSKPGTTVKDHSSASRKEEAGSYRINGQTKNANERKSTRVPLAKSVKSNQSRQDVKKTMSKAARPESSRTSVENSKASSVARKLKVLRFLGLAPPVGSPFVRQKQPTNSVMVKISYEV